MTPWVWRRPFLAICALHEPVQPIVRTSEARDGSGGDTESERGPLELEQLELLILARLSVAGRRLPPAAEVARGLQPAWGRRLTPAQWRAIDARALASLRGRALVDPGRLALTDRRPDIQARRIFF
jgi:hypothetical protein